MRKNYIFEEWKPVKGYEGLYEVSNFGRVKSLPKITNNQYGKEERILKTPKNNNGYLLVCLHKIGEKPKWKSVHRLVAEAFIPNPNNLPCVNHKGENPSKNYVWQLEWCTYQYNNTYGTRNERMIKNRVGKTAPKIVLQYDLNGVITKEWESTMEVERHLGYSHGNISMCCNGKYKSAYGYIWKYKEKAV